LPFGYAILTVAAGGSTSTYTGPLSLLILPALTQYLEIRLPDGAVTSINLMLPETSILPLLSGEHT
jgi:hypothetical protein